MRALVSPEKAGWSGDPVQVGSPSAFQKVSFFEPAGAAYERKLHGLHAFDETEGKGDDEDDGAPDLVVPDTAEEESVTSATALAAVSLSSPGKLDAVR